MSAAVRAGYKLTEVGVIPGDWDALAMSKLFQLKQGVQCPVEKQSAADGKGLRRFIRIVDLTNPKEDWRYIADPGSAHHLEMTDLFMVRYGSPGLVGLGYSGVVANNLFRLIPRRNIESHFYYQYLAQRQEEIAGLSGSSTMPAVSFSTLNHFYVVSPPLQEQRAIATALSDVDALLAKLDALIAKKRDLKVATMQRLLTCQTRLPGFSGEWMVKRLGDVANLKNGYTFRSETYTSLGGYKVITIANVQDGYMVTEGCNAVDRTPSDIQPHQLLKIGDILISMTGNVGRVCRVCEDRCLLNQRVGKLVPTVVNDAFLFALLRQPSFIVAMSGAAKGGAQPNLSAGDIAGYEIFIPSDAVEQSAIATVLSDMDTELTVLEARRDKTRALKQGMMQELLNGRIRLL